MVGTVLYFSLRHGSIQKGISQSIHTAGNISKEIVSRHRSEREFQHTKTIIFQVDPKNQFKYLLESIQFDIPKGKTIVLELPKISDVLEPGIQRIRQNFLSIF